LTDAPTTIERMSAAVVSGNLAHSNERLRDVDVLHAMGVAAARVGACHALLRYDLTQDKRDIPNAVNATMSLVAELARKKGWPMHVMRRRQIAHAVVLQYVSPACPTCDGRGLIGVDRSEPEKYHPRSCPTCGGSGKRELPKQHQRETREVLRRLEAEMDKMVGEVKKLIRR